MIQNQEQFFDSIACARQLPNYGRNVKERRKKEKKASKCNNWAIRKQSRSSSIETAPLLLFYLLKVPYLVIESITDTITTTTTITSTSYYNMASDEHWEAHYFW